MGQYFIVIEKSALEELKAHYISGHKSSIKRIEKIILELSQHPEMGMGNPEKLKFDLSGYWSRQINKKDRLIYRIDFITLTVFVVKAKGHYADK